MTPVHFLWIRLTLTRSKEFCFCCTGYQQCSQFGHLFCRPTSGVFLWVHSCAFVGFFIINFIFNCSDCKSECFVYSIVHEFLDFVWLILHMLVALSSFSISPNWILAHPFIHSHWLDVKLWTFCWAYKMCNNRKTMFIRLLLFVVDY